MRAFLSLLTAALLLCAPAAHAFDASRYSSPTYNAPNVDRLMVQGTGSRIGAAANPNFTEKSGVLSRGLIFDSGGSADTPGSVTVPAGKQLDVMGWRETNIVAGAGSRASWLDFDLRTSGGDASTNLYGVIGALHNAGPGATKALYGRAIADPGSMGVVIGGAFGAETRSGVATSYGIQITNDSTDGTPVTAGIIVDSNRNAQNVIVPHQYGLLLSNKVSIPAGGAGFQMTANGPGAFLKLLNAANTVALFQVDNAGALSTSGLNVSGSSALASLSLSGSVAIGTNGTSISPTTLTMQPQGTISVSSSNRQFQFQGLDAAGGVQERARLLAGGIGDLVQFDVAQNLGVAGFTDRQGATKAILIPNGTCATAAPTGGGVLCVEGGALKFRGSSGTLTTIAPP